MAVPWMRILDSALGLADIALGRGRPSDLVARRPSAVAETGPLEARLTGVVLAALKEAFSRDHERLELEREELERGRRRAERALQLELRRQAGERESGRLRLVAGVAVASWLGTLVLSMRLASGAGAGRIAMGTGWLLLLGALAASFAGQSRLARALSAAGDRDGLEQVSSGPSGTVAPWLVVAGLAAVSLGALLR